MAWKTKRRTVNDGSLVEVYAWDENRPSERFLTSRIDRKNQLIEFYPRDDFFLKTVVLEGFKSLPGEFREAGYLPSIQYYLDKKLANRNVKTLTVSKERDDQYRKVPKKNAYHVVISYESLKRLKRGLTNISTEAKQERSSYADEFFAEVFPTRYKSGERNSIRARSRRVIRNLDASIIEELDPDHIDQILEFVSELLSSRYTSPKRRQELFRAAKVQIDQVAFDDIIKQFEGMLQDDPPETKWGGFLQQNLFLVDSKYIGVIPELNVVLASQRRADFGLVNVDGYLDLFEIKKPSTQLLSSKPDRGNFYWHSQTVKALVQAEKYLFNAERKADAFEADIERERDIDVRVVRPKAVVVIGDSRQLANKKMKDDFRILRESLKNIEVVLYDELLNRLKNQRDKIHLEPEIRLKESLG
jgi:hypothetical protein